MTDEQREDRARKGGQARAEAMTADERSESARKAATERWRRELQERDARDRALLQARMLDARAR